MSGTRLLKWPIGDVSVPTARSCRLVAVVVLGLLSVAAAVVAARAMAGASITAESGRFIVGLHAGRRRRRCRSAGLVAADWRRSGSAARSSRDGNDIVRSGRSLRWIVFAARHAAGSRDSSPSRPCCRRGLGVALVHPQMEPERFFPHSAFAGVVRGSEKGSELFFESREPIGVVER